MLVQEGKTVKAIPESSRKEFLRKISANNFALSDTEGDTSGQLNRGGRADSHLFRILLANHQKFQEQTIPHINCETNPPPSIVSAACKYLREFLGTRFGVATLPLCCNIE